MEIPEELLDAILTGDRLVVQEFQLRHAFQTEPRADLAAEERDGSTERPLGISPRMFIAERGEEDPGLLDVGADLDSGDRHETDSRIVDLAREQMAQLASNLIRDTVWT